MLNIILLSKSILCFLELLKSSLQLVNKASKFLLRLLWLNDMKIHINDQNVDYSFVYYFEVTEGFPNNFKMDSEETNN